ncbi:MAG: Uma2 family endonuclease [Phormidesmis sp. CAN_BIN36]|nr:Uma2 family endonuclease [Phormidesmis sp. CAN_BIN36]
MQATEVKKRYSPEEYLALEEKAEFKSEYHDGEIIPMTGGSLNHNRILNRVCAYLLYASRGKDYEPFSSDVRLWIPKYGKFTYPDVMVIQGEPMLYDNRTDTLTNPRSIIEVLSKSIQEYGQNEKFKYYRSIPGLQEYVLINQYELEIQQYAKTENNLWIYRVYESTEDLIKFTSVDVEMNVSEIYEGVFFEEVVSSES